MTNADSDNSRNWNGVERRLNGNSTHRVAIVCDRMRTPRASASTDVRRPPPDGRDELSAQARPVAY